MRFEKLYELICSENAVPVRFERLRELVNAYHHGVGEIKVWAIPYRPANGQAHYVLLGTDRSSGYDEEYIEAEIRYCDSLDDEPPQLKFALTKELMHVFDEPDQVVDTRKKFIRLVREIQNQPLPQHASAMYTSELMTKWMALIILCPKHKREEYISNQKTEIEIAAELHIPEWLVQYILDDYYEEAFAALVPTV